MSRYLKIAGELILFFFIFHSLSFSEESITITTYYPSPYGVYNELQLYPHDPAVTACNDAREGTMFYNSTDRQVYVCKGAASGWQTLGGGGGNLLMVNGATCPGGYSSISHYYASTTCTGTGFCSGMFTLSSCATGAGWSTGNPITYVDVDNFGRGMIRTVYNVPSCTYCVYYGGGYDIYSSCAANVILRTACISN